jgi:hypothetical protein
MARSIQVKEGRMLASFCVDSEHFKNINKDIAPCQGWSNSATWCFNLYFMQERKLIDELIHLIRKDNTINYSRAATLFNRFQINNQMEQIDDDSEGCVNVVEIIDTFLEEYLDGKN